MQVGEESAPSHIYKTDQQIRSSYWEERIQSNETNLPEGLISIKINCVCVMHFLNKKTYKHVQEEEEYKKMYMGEKVINQLQIKIKPTANEMTRKSMKENERKRLYTTMKENNKSNKILE